MRVCVYLENARFLKSFGDTGIGNAAKLQRIALQMNGIEVCDSWRDDYDLIDLNPVSFTECMYVAKYAKKHGRKVVVHVHTTFENFANSFWFWKLTSPIVYRNMVKLYRLADALICVSEYTSDWVKRIGIEQRTFVIGNAIEVEKFRKGKRRYYRELYGLDGIVPFSVGLVIPRKGIETFVNLARSFPDLKFVWFGPLGKGLIRSFRAEQIVRNAPENVIFTGYVKDIVSAYAAGDIFVFPSLSETFGYVVLEALASGKPVIVRDLDVYSWLPRNLVLRAMDDNDFQEKLSLLIEDEKLRKNLSKKGPKFAKRFGPKKVGRKLVEAFEEVLAYN